MKACPLRRMLPALLAAGLSWLAGCAQEGPSRGPIFYPPSPDAPRVQFLTSFTEAEDWLDSGWSFADFVLGSDAESEGFIEGPFGLATWDGKLYVCDLVRGMVHVIGFEARTYTVLGTREEINNPVNITIDTDGTKYVSDTVLRKVAVFNADDEFVGYLGDEASLVPSDVAITESELFMTDIAEAEVEVWSKEGEFLRKFGGPGQGHDQFTTPIKINIGPDDRVYVTDRDLCTIKVFDQQGVYQDTISEQGDRAGYLARPKGTAIDPEGRLLVTDSLWEIVQVFRADGQLLFIFGGLAAGEESMGMPSGIAVDTSALEFFRPYIASGFEAEFLIFVANQFGVHKIGVYAFGEMPDWVPPELHEEAAASADTEGAVDAESAEPAEAGPGQES